MPVGDSILIADRLELLRSAIVVVLSMGHASGVGDDRACLARVEALSASFTAAAAQFRTHILTNYTNLSTPAARGVMCDMVNHDLRLWLQELVRFAHHVRPEVIPPPAETVFAAPPVPAFDRTLAFCKGGNDVLEMIADVTQGLRSGVDGSNKQKSGAANVGLSSPGTGSSRKKSSQVCRQFASTGHCKWRD